MMQAITSALRKVTRLLQELLLTFTHKRGGRAFLKKQGIMRQLSGKLFITIMLSLTAAGAGAQTFSSTGGAIKPPAIKKPKPIRTETSFGLRLNSDGWSAFADRGTVKSGETKLRDQFYNVPFFQLELSEHKNQKEVKRSVSEQPTGGSDKTKPFIYGKVNNFYTLKLGYGLRRMIAGKPEEGTVSIHWVYSGGLSLGMEKPYYLDGYVEQDNGTRNAAIFKYTDETKLSFLRPEDIRGSAGFAKGLNEIGFVPGIHAKTALHFDFASSRYTVMAVETGINAEYYSRPITIMANQDAKPYFVNLFASFQFGYRK